MMLLGGIGLHATRLQLASRALPKDAVDSLPSQDQTMALIRKRRSIFPKDYTGKVGLMRDLHALHC